MRRLEELRQVYISIKEQPGNTRSILVSWREKFTAPSVLVGDDVHMASSLYGELELHVIAANYSIERDISDVTAVGMLPAGVTENIIRK